MTPAEREVRRRLAAKGALPIAELMEIALAGGLGYYADRDPLGEAGDFITAPEISQMFGELIGLFLLDSWHRLGAPAPFHLVELGPGRGSLMADALRAAGRDPAFLAARRLHLVEINAALKAMQGRALAAHAPLWHESLDAVPAGPFLLIANEFLDALPIHQFQRTPRGWRERVVVAAAGGGLAFALAPPGGALALIEPGRLEAAPVGAVIEAAPAALALAARIARRAAAQPGLALVIDYGPSESGAGEILQAVKAHRLHPPLADIGEADLSAHVDFAALARAARREGARVFGPAAQGAFLRALGIERRALRLQRDAGAEDQARIARQLRRLTGAAEMGDLFKAMAIASPSLAELAGL